MSERTERAGARRIGIGGIAIESSTFSPLLSTRDDFTVLRGDAMQPRYPFLPGWRFRGRADFTWLPCLHARALPGGAVTAETYAALKHELLDAIAANRPLDGFYLDIHGAMSVAGMDDAEGNLTTAIRELVGPDCIISAGMDLHGNVSPSLVEQVDLFTAYRHAPHIDALETRERACANLVAALDHGWRPARAYVSIPVILPGERTSTRVEPARSLFARLPGYADPPAVIDASLWVGYVWADEPRSGASVVVTGLDHDRIRETAEEIARGYWTARHRFDFSVPAGDAEWCIAQALASSRNPVLISDSGDNPTAGGAGDVPYLAGLLLSEPVLAAGEQTAIFASLVDPVAVEACQQAGLNGTVETTLGGKLDPVHGISLPIRGWVSALVPGDLVGGDLAVIQSGGVSIIVTSRRKPFHRLRDFTVLGLDPAAADLIVVKIGYLEPELHDLAKDAYLALTPGAVNQDIPSLQYERVRRPIFPLDVAMADLVLTAKVFPL